MPWLGDGTWVADARLARDIVHGRTHYRPWSHDLATAIKGNPKMSERTTTKRVTMTVICGLDCRDDETGERLFWNPEMGWGSLHNAAVYSADDLAAINLPSIGSHAVFVDAIVEVEEP